jgi:hypothetical protein
MCEDAASALESVGDVPTKSGRKESRPATKRTRKDPDAPKRPATAYTLFVAENRSRHAKDGMTAQAVMKEVAAAWKALSEEGRRPYSARADVAKTDYQKLLLEFKATKAAESSQHEANATAEAVVAARLDTAYDEPVELAGAHAHAHAAMRAVLPHNFEAFDGIPLHAPAAVPAIAPESAHKKSKKSKKSKKHHSSDS